jgi:hypothetical protein
LSRVQRSSLLVVLPRRLFGCEERIFHPSTGQPKSTCLAHRPGGWRSHRNKFHSFFFTVTNFPFLTVHSGTSWRTTNPFTRIRPIVTLCWPEIIARLFSLLLPKSFNCQWQLVRQLIIYFKIVKNRRKQKISLFDSKILEHDTNKD